jgi:2-polyprenyl-3-methyl-5-hydroxy-6-metoxy-1,4-benzoquinol methylase
MDEATSQQIAAHAGLQERYVREWLGAMVTGGVVRYDSGERTCHLPPEHAAFLTRQAAPDNVAAPMQWLAVLGQVESDIVDCFRDGGGVPYTSYARFDEVMMEESAQSVVSVLLDHIVPLVPGLSERLVKGIDVLDIGCGAGLAINTLAAAFPRSRFRGYDISESAIERARNEAKNQRLTNVRFEVRDVSDLRHRGDFDLITAFDAIHDQREPARVLREMATALRGNGWLVMQDIDTSTQLENNVDHPVGTFLYTISTMHCMPVSLAQNGAGLGTCWGVELARQMLLEAGFRGIEVRRLPHDLFNCYYVATKAGRVGAAFGSSQERPPRRMRCGEKIFGN